MGQTRKSSKKNNTGGREVTCSKLTSWRSPPPPSRVCSRDIASQAWLISINRQSPFVILRFKFSKRFFYSVFVGKWTIHPSITYYWLLQLRYYHTFERKKTETQNKK